MASCHDFGAGTQLSGKVAEVLDYQPGTCAPLGGDAVGELVLAEPFTACCYAPVI